MDETTLRAAPRDAVLDAAVASELRLHAETVASIGASMHPQKHMRLSREERRHTSVLQMLSFQMKKRNQKLQRGVTCFITSPFESANGAEEQKASDAAVSAKAGEVFQDDSDAFNRALESRIFEPHSKALLIDCARRSFDPSGAMGSLLSAV